MATVEKLIVELDAKVDGYVKDMKTAGKVTKDSTDEMEKGFKNASENIKVLGQAMAAAAAVAAVLIQQAAANAVELQNNARVAGLSIERFQGLASAYKTVGIEADKFADISKDVTDRIGDFLQTGGGPLVDFFENVGPQIGITAQALQGLSGHDALQAVKNGMDAVNLSAEEQVFHLEAIASDASFLIPLLNENGTEMNRLAGEFEKFNTVLTETDVSKLTALDKVITDLSDSMTNKLAKSVAFFADDLVALSVNTGAILESVGTLLVAGWAKIFRELQEAALNFQVGYARLFKSDEALEALILQRDQLAETNAVMDEFHIEELNRINIEREARLASYDENIEKAKELNKIQQGGGDKGGGRAKINVDNDDKEAKASDKKFKAKIKGQKDYTNTAATLNRAFFKDNQAVGAGIIVANTAVAVTEAAKVPVPGNIPAIAFAVATGAAQLAALKGASVGGGSIGGGGGGGGGAAVAPVDQSQLFENESSLFLSAGGEGEGGQTAGGGLIRFDVDSGDELLDAIAGALNNGLKNGKFGGALAGEAS